MKDRIVINVTFLDTVKLYKQLMDMGELEGKSSEHKIAVIEQLFRKSCRENHLLDGAEKVIMGDAWARFLHQRAKENPQQVADFIKQVSAPEMFAAIEKVQPILSEARTLSGGALIFHFVNHAGDLKPLGDQLRKIAGDTGMVNYDAGETLTSVIGEFAARVREEHGATLPEKPPEEAGFVPPLPYRAKSTRNAVLRTLRPSVS